MAKRQAKSNGTSKAVAPLPDCGLVMPISDTVGYPAGHWRDVHAILVEAARKAGYSAALVSESDDTRVIQDSIVKNLWKAEIVIVDVSAKNPNVLFELGMRLTFDKPVVIVKDNRTDYIFDVGNISTIPYPADLRYKEMNAFKEDVANRIKATVKQSKEPGYSSFLKQFSIVDYRPKIEEKQGGKDDLIIEMLRDMQSRMNTASAMPIAVLRGDQFLKQASKTAPTGKLSQDGIKIVIRETLKTMQLEKYETEKALCDEMVSIIGGVNRGLNYGEAELVRGWTMRALAEVSLKDHERLAGTF